MAKGLGNAVFSRQSMFQKFRAGRYKELFANFTPKDPAVTFADVNMLPNLTELESRSVVDVGTKIGNLRLPVPVMGTNWLCVNGELAALTALNGGLAVLSRDFPIEKQVDAVSYVKNFHQQPKVQPLDARLITDLNGLNMTVRDAINLMKKNRKNILFFTKGNGGQPKFYVTYAALMGFVNAEKENLGVGQCLSPIEVVVSENQIKSHADVNKIARGGERLENGELSKPSPLLMVADGDGKFSGYLFYDYMMYEGREMTLDENGRLAVAAAVGVAGLAREVGRAERLLSAGADMLVIDVAHGHSKKVFDLIREFRRLFPTVTIIAGNIATAEAAEELLLENVGVKVGVGPGRACKTRVRAGAGRAQLKAVLEASIMRDYLQKYGFLDGHISPVVIADGGFDESNGNMAKALALSDAVMRGGFAGVNEADTERVLVDGKVWAEHAGNGSEIHRLMIKYNCSAAEALVLNAREANVAFNPYAHMGAAVNEGDMIRREVSGPTAAWMAVMRADLKAACGYNGARNLEELRRNVYFEVQTVAGIQEGKPRPKA